MQLRELLISIYNTLFLNFFNVRNVYYVISLIWCIPILIFIYILSPFFLIRLGLLPAKYLGHFVGDVELCLLQNKQNKLKILHYDFWVFETMSLVNTEIQRIWKNRLTIFPRLIFFPCYKFITKIKFMKKHILKSHCYDRDVTNALDLYKSDTFFNENQVNIGNEILNKLGVPINSKIVCLIVRDGAYHKNMSFTNYRNAKIENYYEAINELIRLDYYVIRMGRKAEKKIKIDNEKFIDYAFSDLQSDFMDVFIGSRCTFTISSSTGWDTIPTILFRKPQLLTDFVPVSLMPSWGKKNIIILKRYFSKSKKRYLFLDEVFELIDSDFNTSKPKEFNALGIKLVDNSPSQITKAALEMEKFVTNGNFDFNDENIERQIIFRNKFEKLISKFNYSNFHGVFNARIGSDFLKEASELYLLSEADNEKG